jgi:O-succinylbenzoate synthase
MTDYSELIKRLRDLTDENFGDLDPFSKWGREMVAAADALKAQAKEIAGLKEQLAEANAANLTFGNQSACIAELEAALRFYADPHKFTDCNGDDVQVPDFYDELDFGATARAALNGEK